MGSLGYIPYSHLHAPPGAFPSWVHQAGSGGTEGSWYQGCQSTSVLVPLAGCHLLSSSLSPSGLTKSLNGGPMPPQRPGTRDQTYLDELISIPKGSGVGAARLAHGGQGSRTVLQGAGGGEAKGHCSGEYVSWTCPGDMPPLPQIQLRQVTALG